MELHQFKYKIEEFELYCFDLEKSFSHLGTRNAIVNNQFKFNDVNFQDNDIYVEIGAHNGLIAFYLAKKYPNIQIHIFECNPIMIAAINLGMVINNIFNIRVYPFGLSNKTGVFELGTDPNNTGGSSINEHSQNVIKQNVYIYDFENILSIFEKIKYLKIDIEGEEYAIFNNLKNSNSRFLDRVSFLNLEMHDWIYTNLKEYRPSIEEYINSFEKLNTNYEN